MRPKRTGNPIEWALKSAIAFLILASASLVEAQTIQTVCSFNFTNGALPQAPLTLGNDGNLYGTTTYGGITNSYSSGLGTVFRVTTNGALTTLVSFNGNNGKWPWMAGLPVGNDGNFYGTTVAGGITNSQNHDGFGTVFRMATNGTLTTLVSFYGTNGAAPAAGLASDNQGNFYGTTQGGGSADYGTVFRVTTDGALTTLVSFNFTNGALPYAGLTLGNDGNFYGTTTYGGITNRRDSDGLGTVFRVTTNGTLTTLVSFNFTNGALPYAGLTLGNDGNFYGTTLAGGITNSIYGDGMGTVFRVTTNGAVTTLVSFAITNGFYPYAALTLGNDGDFYGTTAFGGHTDLNNGNGYGTVFKVTVNGTLTTLVSFSGTDGASPHAPLTPDNDGNFYGTTSGGGGMTNYPIFSGGMGTVFRLLLLSPPVITVQPTSQTNNAGATATFLVSAASLTPLGYQWQKNGTNLFDSGNVSGSTSNILTIANISDSDAASYSVIVSNSYGGVTSSNAMLTVIDPPVITAQPTSLLVLAGTNVAFGVSVTGTAPFGYQWQLNGTNLLNATNATYSIPSVGTNNAGNYAAVVTNAAGSATSSNAELTVVLSPKSQTNYASSTATFTATAFSPESLIYQWQKNGTNLVNGGNLSGTTNSTLTIGNVSDADAASYSAVVSDATGSVTTSKAVLTVNDFLFIASQPQSQTVGLGSNATFNVTVYGAPPLVFQWYFDGTPLSSLATGTNSSSYSLTNVGTNQAGNYSVEVVNGYGSLTSSNAVLTVKVFPPVIGLQPSSQRVMMGSSASFSVSVSGTPPFSYQWRFNGTKLLNATNAVYAIQAVGATNTGKYSVVVTNLAGSATSSNALLTVIVPPTLALQFLAGYPLLDLSGMLSSNFVVQYSTNLADTNWTHLLSLTNLPSSPYRFLDSGGVGQPARFYRAFMQ
jgi:uncharacterized repeat protein (TIGR03803 family)